METPWWIRPFRGDALSGADRDAVWALMARHATKDRARFEATLARCDQVWLVRRDDTVRGLVCYESFAETLGGRPVTALYGHWFVLDAELRGHSVTSFAVLRAVLEAKRRHPLRPVIGLAKCSTVNSYLMTLRSAPWTYPSRDLALSADLAALRDRVMTRAVGDRWDGAVCRGGGAFEYREGRARADDADPDVAFYAAANPGQPRGDGLVVVVPCDLANLAGLAANIVRRALRPTPARGTVHG